MYLKYFNDILNKSISNTLIVLQSILSALYLNTIQKYFVIYTQNNVFNLICQSLNVTMKGCMYMHMCIFFKVGFRDRKFKILNIFTEKTILFLVIRFFIDMF